MFRLFDEDAVLTPQLFGYLWGKAGYGAILKASAVDNESIADFMANPARRRLVIGIAQEILRIAAAEGVKPIGFDGFDPGAFMRDDAAAMQASLDRLIAFNRAGHEIPQRHLARPGGAEAPDRCRGAAGPGARGGAAARAADAHRRPPGRDRHGDRGRPPGHRPGAGRRPLRPGARMTACDPVSLEIIRGAARAAQAEMEALLERTAMSAFIREKKDFYTALFDADGRHGGGQRPADLRRHRRPRGEALPARDDAPRRPLLVQRLLRQPRRGLALQRPGLPRAGLPWRARASASSWAGRISPISAGCGRARSAPMPRTISRKASSSRRCG